MTARLGFEFCRRRSAQSSPIALRFSSLTLAQADCGPEAPTPDAELNSAISSDVRAGAGTRYAGPQIGSHFLSQAGCLRACSPVLPIGPGGPGGAAGPTGSAGNTVLTARPVRRPARPAEPCGPDAPSALGTRPSGTSGYRCLEARLYSVTTDQYAASMLSLNGSAR